MSETLQEGRAAPPGKRLSAFVSLAKLSFFDYYLSAFVVWTMLPPGTRDDPVTVWTLAVLTLGWVGVCAATVAFDDVTGFRDGSDQFNYDPEQKQLRSRKRKPLLDGRLTEREAVRFGYAALLTGLVWLGLAVLTSPHRPVWALLLTVFLVFISVQYSYGLRLSYRGGQELVLLLSTGLVVLIPYGLTHGELTGIVSLEAYLFGLWSLLVSVYSNINDVEGDRAAGRRNLAIMLPPPVYRGVIAVLSLSETAVIVLACALGAVPWWFGFFLAPLVAVRVVQVATGLVRNDPLKARKLGGQAHRLGVVLIIVANLFAV
ncbi:UbiA family prenyltransferase [Streptomyces sp. NBC_01808]|uniref:UbiA family prenyltransferase n=1 Tax=Streptomyces sp. NBC_01808 TaxID=2975947 RepID=UPI002DD8C717|nr:UbiA family prenyltransferase [Streptomyces sp. NBC_01808]WSA37553.1 UbiA family prenyltransferase [Streptomyces sp. NBC_01808]